jgi:hypothetical protein
MGSVVMLSCSTHIYYMMMKVKLTNGLLQLWLKEAFIATWFKMKGETSNGALPGFWGYSCLLSLRTGSWNGHLGLTVQLQATWLWLDELAGPPTVGW